jgi:hypothetical protein
MALGSADDVEAALQKIREWRLLPAELADAVMLAAHLRVAVREFLRGRRSGERKGLAKCDQAVILVGQEKTDRGPIVTCIADAFRGEPRGKIMLTRREALIIDGSEGVARMSVQMVTALRSGGHRQPWHVAGRVSWRRQREARGPD